MVKMIEVPDSLRREVQSYAPSEFWVPEEDNGISPTKPLSLRELDIIHPPTKKEQEYKAVKLNLGTQI